MSHIDYDGTGELHITDISTARTMDKSIFDRIITVCQNSIADNVSEEMNYSHYNMSDGAVRVEETYGGSCEYELFEQAADELHDALSDDEVVLIHCHAGRSRSVSVSIAALGRMLEIRRQNAYEILERYRPQLKPDLLLMEHASKYIEDNTGLGGIQYGEYTS